MRKLLLLILLTLPLPTYAQDCMDTPLLVTAREFGQREIMIPTNGVLRIYTGAKEGQVTDVFKDHGDPFGGLVHLLREETWHDDRSAFWKWINPKTPQPNKEYLILYLSPDTRTTILGKTNLALYITIKVSNQTYSSKVIFSKDLSRNCRPN